MIAEFRFRVDDEEHEPGRCRCHGCRMRLRLRESRENVRDPAAFSEDTDVFGRKRYWCRDCTEALYRNS
jgi:hypothetical protein